MIHGVLLAAVGPDRAPDLVQEVFLKALRHLGEIRDPTSFGGWLRTIAQNLARDAYRGPRRPVELPEDVTAFEPPREAAREVLETVRTLPEAYRETLILRLVEGMTGPEISQRTGLTPGSVRVNLCRGMKLLLERLKENGWS
jgi:RNA polymerase sigma-70 factor (ECF subfamily)